MYVEVIIRASRIWASSHILTCFGGWISRLPSCQVVARFVVLRRHLRQKKIKMAPFQDVARAFARERAPFGQVENV